MIKSCTAQPGIRLSYFPLYWLFNGSGILIIGNPGCFIGIRDPYNDLCFIIPTQLGYIPPKTTRVLFIVHLCVAKSPDDEIRIVDTWRSFAWPIGRGAKDGCERRGFPLQIHHVLPRRSPCSTLFHHFVPRILSLFRGNTVIFTYTIHQNQVL